MHLIMLFLVCLALAIFFPKSWKVFANLLIIFVFAGFGMGCVAMLHISPIAALLVAVFIGWLCIRVLRHMNS